LYHGGLLDCFLTDFWTDFLTDFPFFFPILRCALAILLTSPKKEGHEKTFADPKAKNAGKSK